LIDTGAGVSLISKKIYDKLPDKPRIHGKGTYLSTANGESLSNLGQITLQFTMNGLQLTQKFFVIEDLCRNFILGRDWLTENGVRLYFDLGMLRVGKTYVKLEEDIHISAVIRMDKKLVIKPQSTAVCYVRMKDEFVIPDSGLIRVSNVDDECIFDDPCLVLQESVHKVKKTGKLPVVIINHSNRHYKFNRGNVIGKVTALGENEIATVEVSVETNEEEKKVSSEDFANIQVPDIHREDIWEIIKKNKDLFAKTDSELGQSDTVKMKIDTGDQNPIKNRPYRAPLNKRIVIENALQGMLEAKVIERSMSPWAFPLVVVKKKDGSDRMCVDFRTLNKIVRPASYPLPLIDDILALLGGSTCFSSLDMKSGYWQVRMDENSKEKTAFACHKGLFQFNVMPFGLHNAPAVFQELMNIVLQGCESFAIAYLDDILIFSKNPEEHKEHIKIVFDRLRMHDLKLKLKKCNFFEEETEYLGFKVGKDGVKANPKKVEAIKNMPAPKSVREVRGFIGTISYYRRFVPNFSKIAEPLVNLTRKFARFKWTPECQTAFEFLKNSLAVVPLLAYPDTNKPYVLYTDASDSCLGACLTQETDEGEEKPIYFLSHKLSPTQTRWSTIEKEGFAIYYALQKLDHYLHNAQFVIKTDHKPLKYLLDVPIQNAKIQRWSLSIAGYNCTIEYIMGKENHCADLLSRIPSGPNDTQEEVSGDSGDPEIDDRTFEISTINSNRFDPKSFASCRIELPDEISKADITLTGDFDMRQEQEGDENIVKLKNRLQKGTATKFEQNHYFETDGLTYFLSQADSEEPRLRLYIPQRLETVTVNQYHDQLGHMALDKTYDSLRSKYYFPNMYKKIGTHIDQCITCQVRSDKKSKPPLQETDIPPFPFAKMGLDLSGPYPTTLSGNRYIVAFIDIYSGYPEAYAIPDKSAYNIAYLLIEEIFPRYGSALEIITDNGSENLNRKVKETLEALNIHHITTSFYSPQANGRVERFHRTLHDVISKKIQDRENTWDLHLNQTLAAIRFHINESSRFSPFYLLNTRDVVLPLDTILKPRRRYMGEDQHQIALQEQHKAFVRVHRHMKEAKKRQKGLADRNSKEVCFKVGDPVYLKKHRRTGKLDSKWRSHFRIIKETGPLSYIVKDQLSGKTEKTHARHIRLANMEWKEPQVTGKPIRKSLYVVPPESESESGNESSDNEQETELKRVIRFKRQEREDSSDEEDNIPLMELRRRIHLREQNEQKTQNESVDDQPVMGRENSDENNSSEGEEPMEIDLVEKQETGFLQINEASKSEFEGVVARDDKGLVKNLLAAIQDML
jgi:transposase InsO family protein